MLQAKRFGWMVVMAAVFFGEPLLADNGVALGLCVNCHGEDGIGTDSGVPIIAGIPAIVQEDALYAYIDGDRDCVDMPLMCNIVSRLSEQQVVELAGYYAALPFQPAGEDFDAALAARGKATHLQNCAICHGENDPGDGEASILHGQRKDYLRYVMQEYAAGERAQLPPMESAMRALSAEDIEALVNYYASEGR